MRVYAGTQWVHKQEAITSLTAKVENRQGGGKSSSAEDDHTVCLLLSGKTLPWGQYISY